MRSRFCYESKHRCVDSNVYRTILSKKFQTRVQQQNVSTSQDSSHRSVNEMEEVARRAVESVARTPIFQQNKHRA